jgi:pyruvate dehydrogenase E1 component alpha subunit
MSDPQKYRTKEEVGKYQEHDPIGRLEKILREKKIVDDAAIVKINEQIHAEVEAAHAEADKAPFPPVDDVWKDVYAEPYGPYKKRD